MLETIVAFCFLNHSTNAVEQEGTWLLWDVNLFYLLYKVLGYCKESCLPHRHYSNVCIQVLDTTMQLVWHWV